jgi:hypothetical protein
MAKISTRDGLITYCLRALGHPVLQINVDPEQLQDRVDDALQFFHEYHFDGSERVLLKYQLTQNDIDNRYISLINEGVDSFGGQETQEVVEAGLTGSIGIESTITTVIQVFSVSQSSYGMWDIRYQYALNDLYAMGSIDLVHYSMTQQYLAAVRQILSPDKIIRFNRRGNKLYFDGRITNLVAGDYMIIEAYRILDPTAFPEVYDDMLLKRYCTQLFKRQWAQNLLKYSGVQMIGQTTLNAQDMWDQADKEINKIEDEVVKRWELPPVMQVG